MHNFKITTKTKIENKRYIFYIIEIPLFFLLENIYLFSLHIYIIYTFKQLLFLLAKIYV